LPALLKANVRWKSALWLAWAAIAVVLTSRIVLWHVEYFRSPARSSIAPRSSGCRC
jgi:hypothetical protein